MGKKGKKTIQTHQELTGGEYIEINPDEEYEDPYTSGNGYEDKHKQTSDQGRDSKTGSNFKIQVRKDAHKEILSQRSSQKGNRLLLNDDMNEPLGLQGG